MEPRDSAHFSSSTPQDPTSNLLKPNDGSETPCAESGVKANVSNPSLLESSTTKTANTSNVFQDDSDRGLMDALADQNENPQKATVAFESLYNLYAGILGAFLLRLFSLRGESGSVKTDQQLEYQFPDVVEETLQEVFLKVWRSAKHWRGESKVSTWLFQIAKNEGFSTLRKQARQKSRKQQEKKMAEQIDSIPRVAQTKQEPSPLDQMASVEHIDELRNAIRDLPEEQQTVLILSRIEGLSFKQIGDLTGIPIGTLKSRFAVALAELRRKLKD